jgi:hypothetical protein
MFSSNSSGSRMCVTGRVSRTTGLSSRLADKTERTGSAIGYKGCVKDSMPPTPGSKSDEGTSQFNPGSAAWPGFSTDDSGRIESAVTACNGYQMQGSDTQKWHPADRQHGRLLQLPTRRG